MRKIPTLFTRNPERMSQLLPEVHPDCAWVIFGEGIARQKLDGTAVMIDGDGAHWKRRTIRKGGAYPNRFLLCQRDPHTGKSFGWVPITTEDRWHLEALGDMDDQPEGTYELVGPKVQGNPERIVSHRLIAHAKAPTLDAPRTFDGLRMWLAEQDIEGVVWHHPDGRMAKIKLRDFGLKRGES